MDDVIDSWLIDVRATGRTTRLIDQFIQDLFTKPGQWIRVQDHHSSVEANKNMLARVIKRLNSEHPYLFTSANFELDKHGRKMRLIMDPKKLQAFNDRINGK